MICRGGGMWRRRLCLSGYAITRRNPPGDPHQYENEQLFLRLVDGQWQSIAEGTGISCSDDDLRPELMTPCRGPRLLNSV